MSKIEAVGADVLGFLEDESIELNELDAKWLLDLRISDVKFLLFVDTILMLIDGQLVN
jgi:hypothetical protein